MIDAARLYCRRLPCSASTWSSSTCWCSFQVPSCYCSLHMHFSCFRFAKIKPLHQEASDYVSKLLNSHFIIEYKFLCPCLWRSILFHWAFLLLSTGRALTLSVHETGIAGCRLRESHWLSSCFEASPCIVSLKYSPSLPFSLVIATGYELDGQGLGSLHMKEILLYFTTSRPTQYFTQPPMKRIQGASSNRVNRLEIDADLHLHLLPSWKMIAL